MAFVFEEAKNDKIKQQIVQISYQAYCKLHEIEELLRDVPEDKRKEYLSFAKGATKWINYIEINDKEDC